MCLEVAGQSSQMSGFRNSKCAVGLAFAVVLQEVRSRVVEVVAREGSSEVLEQERQRRRHCCGHRWDSRTHSYSVLADFPS